MLRFAVSVPLVLDADVAGVPTAYGPEPFGHELALKLEMLAPHLAAALKAAMSAHAADAEVRGPRRQALRLVATNH